MREAGGGVQSLPTAGPCAARRAAARGTTTEQVRAAAASGNLPDVLDFDGPFLYNYAWSGKLKPLDSCVSQPLLNDLLPSIRQQGTYAGRLWGLGTFDSGLGLFVRPSILRKVGARIPTDPDDAWTAAELTDILHRLRRAGYRRPLDLKLYYIASSAGMAERMASRPRCGRPAAT